MTNRRATSQPEPGEHVLPLPVSNADNAGFWDGCRAHELRLQRCRQCSHVRHTPRPMCPQCTSLEFDWMRASGRGTVFSFTIVHGPTLPVFQERTPYNVVVVELDEGAFLVSNLVDCRNDEISIGMPVEVVFDDVSDAVTLPRFRPRAGSGL